MASHALWTSSEEKALVDFLHKNKSEAGDCKRPKGQTNIPQQCRTSELIVMIKVEIHYLHLASIYYTDSLIY